MRGQSNFYDRLGSQHDRVIPSLFRKKCGGAPTDEGVQQGIVETMKGKKE